MKILNVQGLTNVKYTELQEEVMEKTILSWTHKRMLTRKYRWRRKVGSGRDVRCHKKASSW